MEERYMGSWLVVVVDMCRMNETQMSENTKNGSVISTIRYENRIWYVNKSVPQWK